ncbi:MAG: hypothetical protein ACOY0T_11540 [Myxococcota bacterium]
MLSGGTERSRERRALLFAVLLHALLLGAPRSSNIPGVPSAPALPPATSSDVELDLETATSRESASSEQSTAAAPESVARPRVPARRENRAGPSQPSELSAPEIASEAEAVPNEAGDASPQQPIDLGLGSEGWRRFALDQSPTSEGAPGENHGERRPLFRAPPASTTGGLLEGLEERDRALGLSPSGRVRSALLQAAHTEVAPQLGVARFHVTLTREGQVEVSLKSFSDNKSGWEAVAQRAADELRRSPPRIPPPRKGARMLVEIKAESVMPNGAKAADFHGPRLEARPPRIRSLEASKEAIKDKNPATNMPTEPGRELAVAVDVPGVFVSVSGKVCKVRAGITPFGLAIAGGCDPSNIGAKPMRMVHSRVSEESLF